MNLDQFNVLAGVATLISLAISFIQTIRFRTSQQALAELRRARNMSLWQNISMVLSAYDTIEDARKLTFEADGPLVKERLAGKIGSARRSIVNQYLSLLREAILDEPVFTEETVQEWKRIGRLENEWRVAQAMKYTQRITSK